MTKKIDTDAIKKLAEILTETGLSEIECETEGMRIYVAKKIEQTIYASHPPDSINPKSPQIPNVQQTQSKEVQKNKNFITSPMVGTAYIAPDPSSPPFVKIGDTIKKGQTLLIIEAMKVMNPLKAINSGVIKEILIKDGSPVEFSQNLFVLE